MEEAMRILGIDPGLQTCGYSCLHVSSGGEKLIEAGIFETDGNLALEARLDQIAADMRALLKRLTPDLVAIEQLYSHYAHPRTAILMAHARGVILQTCVAAGAQLKSFSATRIKKSITGNGRASKAQIQRSIQTILHLPELPEPDDVADAVAAALCCADSLHSIATAT